MNLPVFEIVYATSILSAVPVVIDARRRGRRSPAFDGLIAAVIPGLGVMMYVSSVRMGLTPPPLEKTSRMKHVDAIPESPSLVAELTAEVKRLRAEVAELQTRLDERSSRE